MRTLKKTLCLVLCLVMMVGLCAIGANAVDFTDEEQITYKEAVALLSGIGVINGKPDGESFKFDPKGTLTRAEAAKIICYLHDMQDVTGTANFTDTVGHWAEGPIAYCASKGIVAGYGDGTFGPDDTLKGYQFGKMLLCALGFSAEYEKLVGADFEINCATLLKTKKLLAGIDDFDGRKDLTRETAAQMAFNALSAAEVNYPAGAMTVKTGDGTEINVGAGNWFDTADRLADNFNLPVAAGALAPNIAVVNGVPATNGTKASTTVTPMSFAYDFGIDNYGRLLKIFYKNGTGNKTVYAYEDLTKEVEITATMTAAQVKSAFKAAGVTTATVPAGYDVIKNGAGINGGTGALITLGTDNGAAVGAGTFYINATGAAPVVYAKKIVDQDTKVVSKVTAYTAPTEKAAGTITIDGVTAAAEIGVTAAVPLQKVGSEDPDIIELYDGIAVGDYVYVTKSVAGQGTMKVEKATVVEGAATTAFASNKATIGGKQYTKQAFAANRSVTAADTALATLGLTPVDATTVSGTTLRNYVLTASGKVLGWYAYTAASNAKDYAQILQLQWKAGSAGDLDNPSATYAKLLVKILLPDGSTDVYSYTSQKKLSVLAGTVDTKIDGFYEEVEALANAGAYTDGQAASPLAAGDVIKYAASNKAFSEIEKQTEAAAVNAATLTAKTAKVAANVYLTSSTPVIYWDAVNARAKVVTGYADVQAATAAQSFFVTDVQGKVVCVFVQNAYVVAPTTATTVAYIPTAIVGGTADATKWDDTLKANVYGYNVYIDGAETTLWAKTKTLACAAGFIEYTLTDGYLSAVSAAPTGLTVIGLSAVNNVDDKNIDIGGNQYALGSVKIITHDTADDSVVAGGTLAKTQNVVALYKAVSGVNTLQYIAIIK